MYPDDRNHNYYEPPPPVYQVPTYHETPLTAGFIVPGLQALTTGLFTGLTALALAAWFGLPWLPIGATCFCVACLLSWLSYRGHWAWTLEKLLGIDLNRDGHIGPWGKKKTEIVRVEVIQDGGRKGDFIDLPVTPQQLKSLAVGIVEHKKQFATSLWVGNGQLFSRSEFDKLRATMLERGLAEWKNEKSQNQGVEFTPQGKAVLRYLASDRYQPPALSDGE